MPVEKVSITFKVNGKTHRLKTYPMARLLDVLRDSLKMTGVKEGCGEGECGACAIQMNGVLVNSCLVPALQANGAKIRTVEGLKKGETLHPVQQAFLECAGAQCGICTPGMLMAVTTCLEENPNATTEEVRRYLAGNLCRCTGFMQILESARQAQKRKRRSR